MVPWFDQKEVVDDHLVELFRDGQESVESHRTMSENRCASPRMVHRGCSHPEAKSKDQPDCAPKLGGTCSKSVT